MGIAPTEYLHFFMFPKILTGIQVLDFSRLLPGPFATTLLQKLGAEVCCVVAPNETELLPSYTPFENLEHGKKILKVDLKSEEGRQKTLELVRSTDILLEGFRPGAMERLGLGFKVASKINSKILYASLHGYPEGHPHYLLGAHDLNFLIDSGIYSLIFSDSSQEIPAIQLADLVGGFYAVFQILLNHFSNGKNPAAKHLKISIFEGLELFGSYLGGEKTAAVLPLLSGGLARYRIYSTQDGQRIAVASLEPKFYQNLMKVLEIEVLSEEQEETIAKKIQMKFSSKPLIEWKERFKNVDACVSFIPSRPEVLRSYPKNTSPTL